MLKRIVCWLSFLFFFMLFVVSVFAQQQQDNKKLVSLFTNICNRIIVSVDLSNSKPGVDVSITYNNKTIDSFKSALNRFNSRLALNSNTKYTNSIYGNCINVFYKILDRNIKRYSQNYIVGDLIFLLNKFSNNPQYIIRYADIKNIDIDICYLLLKAKDISNFSKDDKNDILIKYAYQNQGEIIGILLVEPKLPQKNDLLTLLIKSYPDQLLQAFKAFPHRMRVLANSSSNKDFNLLYKISKNRDAKALYPFFIEIKDETLTIEDIVKKYTLNDKYFYYHLLVKTRLDHLLKIETTNDTPLNFNLLYKNLAQFADKNFITKINERHYQPDNQRFKYLRKFVEFDLYYLIVCGSDILYTSSFLHIYRTMVSFLKNRDGEKLLKSVHYDKYRKFITTVATYDCLESKNSYAFLNLINAETRKQLFKRFVSDIDLSNRNYLENATDIIGSFSGIKDVALVKEILGEVNHDLEKHTTANDKKGVLVYSIFKQIIQNYFKLIPSDSAYSLIVNKLRLLPIQNLIDGKHRILFEQVFFYGDDDALNSYNYLLYTFNKKNWRTNVYPHWVTIESIKGVPIKIFINKPQYLDTSDYLANQIALRNYLYKNNIYPSVVMHRGHSYFLASTITQLPFSTKLFIMGACGSNNSVNSALEICNQAQVISTRQIATSVVNSKVFLELNEDLRNNRNIDWSIDWKSYGEQFLNTKHKDNFDEYIMPYDNLVNVFFKIYYQRISELY